MAISGASSMQWWGPPSLKGSCECPEFIIRESFTRQLSLHIIQLVSSQVQVRLGNNLVPVDNQTGIVRLLTAISQEQADMITLLVSSTQGGSKIKVSPQLYF